MFFIQTHRKYGFFDDGDYQCIIAVLVLLAAAVLLSFIAVLRIHTPINRLM